MADAAAPGMSDLRRLLERMQPALHPGRYAFVVAGADVEIDPAQVVASIREPEGMSLVVPLALAGELGLEVLFEAAWITLSVHSDLAAVGFTAAFSTALAEAGIGCNVVAGARHDHLFVPADRARQAMDVLRTLSQARA
ncbi:MAG: ACT domain-containing protein [Thermomonas sp.]